MGNADDRYRSRADLEQELAARASDPRLKRIHENMARMYAALSQTSDAPNAADPAKPLSGTPTENDGSPSHR